MADSNDSTGRDLQALAAELRKLEGEYTMYFAGRLPRPPVETRARVEALIRKYDRTQFETSALRFRFQSLQARFASFADLWDRGLRAREEGRPGPFAWGTPPAAPDGAGEPASGSRVVRSVAFRDPASEPDKIRMLHETLNAARREVGKTAVPYDRFAKLVTGQVARLQHEGAVDVVFRVAVQDGIVSLTAKGRKAAG